MKFFWNLAAKNLFRHRLRTFVSISAIAISVMVVVFARGIIMGFVDNTFALHIQYKAGHLRIINKEYNMKERVLSLNYPVNGFHGEGVDKMMERLENLEGIDLLVPRIKFGAMASNEGKLVKMMGWGIDPQKEGQFTDINDMITEGRMIQAGKREVLMGAGILRDMERQVGDKITILYNTSFNSFKASTFRIVGKIESNLKLLENKLFYLPLDQAQDILILPEQVTELLLLTPNLNEVDKYIPGVRKEFEKEGVIGDYSIIPWDKSDSMIQLMKIALNIYDIIYVFLVLLASFVVINTMIMIVKERTREIGMMSALGLKSQEILKLFLMEGFIMAVTGSFSGAILGGIITKVLATIGFDYTEAMSGMSEDMLMNTVIYPVFSFKNMVYAFILGIIVTTITAVIPARRAAHLEPNEALRNI
jgi:putative ABC transport system permease protein